MRNRGRGRFSISLVSWVVCSVGRAGVVSLLSFARYLLVAVDVNKQWSGCKRPASLGKIRLCRGTRSSASHTSEARATQVLSSKGPAATGPFHDSLRYPLLLIFLPDRVEVPGNAGHVHREAQDFKKQVHRLHPNRRSERCPQADSAAVKILPHRPRWETSYSPPGLEQCRSNGQSNL